jgi:hypothetical protein
MELSVSRTSHVIEVVTNEDRELDSTVVEQHHSAIIDLDFDRASIE